MCRGAVVEACESAAVDIMGLRAWLDRMGSLKSRCSTFRNKMGRWSKYKKMHQNTVNKALRFLHVIKNKKQMDLAAPSLKNPTTTSVPSNPNPPRPQNLNLGESLRSSTLLNSSWGNVESLEAPQSNEGPIEGGVVGETVRPVFANTHAVVQIGCRRLPQNGVGVGNRNGLRAPDSAGF